MNLEKNEQNDFSFSAFLIKKGFEKKDYPAGLSTYEFEIEDGDKEKTKYYCISIKHLEKTMTAASSNRDGLFAEAVDLPIDEQVAETFIDDFLK